LHLTRIISTLIFSNLLDQLIEDFQFTNLQQS